MFLLDTNILSELMKRDPAARVLARFEAAPDEQLFTSAICVEEIAFGASIAPAGNRHWERFETQVLPWLTVLEFGLNSAFLGGPLRGDWHRRGHATSYADALIAATAKAHGLTLVTRNARHFDHVSGLAVENWFE